MPLTKIQIPPGINRTSTQYAAGATWNDCNNIRFRGGYAEALSGWERDGMYSLQGIGRESFSHTDYAGNKYNFVGTTWKFYVIAGDDIVRDITGLDSPATLTDIFTSTSGSHFLLVTIADHARKINDWINFTSVATAVGGISTSILTQVRGFQITEIVDEDNFYIEIIDESTGLPVNADASGGQGGSCTYRYRSQSGVSAEVIGLGWGAGGWSTGGWGEASGVQDGVLTDTFRRVYIDNYGEDVLFASSGGPIFYWDTSSNTDNGVPQNNLQSVCVSMASTEFSGASDPPTVVDSFLISKRDGSCVGFGCNDIGGTNQNSLLVRWSDQNNPFDWTPTPTNTAGGQVLRVGSKIIGGVPTKDEVVVFTDSAVYSMRFIGPPDVFAFSLITQNVEIISHKSAVATSSSVYFMGNDGFYVYSGGAVQPLECPISKYIYDDLNTSQSVKCFGSTNSKYSEIYWFYPSKSGIRNGSFEPDKYVCLNYEDMTWSFGDMDMNGLDDSSGLQTTVYNRTSWRDSIITDYPMATYIYRYNTNPDNVGDRSGAVIQETAVMRHDFGTSAQGQAMNSFVESGDFELSDGEQMSFYSRIIPDLLMFNSSGASSADISINGKYYPGQEDSDEVSVVTANFEAPVMDGSTVITKYTVGSGLDSNSYVQDMNVRGRARAASIKCSSSNTNAQWRLGDVRIDVRDDGMR